MVCDGIVVDANCMSYYLHYEFNDEENELKSLINCLLKACGLVINPIIEQEWRNTVGGQLFNIWFDDNFTQGRIHLVENGKKLSTVEKRRLGNDFGFPINGRDIHYINCSLNTLLKYILTSYIDFYDPTKKESPSIEKKRLKSQRAGRLCKFLQKEYGITVGLSEHCIDDLSRLGLNFDS